MTCSSERAGLFFFKKRDNSETGTLPWLIIWVGNGGGGCGAGFSGTLAGRDAEILVQEPRIILKIKAPKGSALCNGCFISSISVIL